jgi:raffinose/stachyose/melibiose transport system permease protein
MAANDASVRSGAVGDARGVLAGVTAFARRHFTALLLLPALVLFLGFYVLPTIGSYWLAFFEWSGLGPVGSFVGLDNFSRLFHDSRFLHSALHNVWIFLVLFVITNIASLGLALLLDRRFALRNIYRAVIFLPYVLSPLAIGFIWQVLLSPNIGLLNPALKAVGLGGLQHEWLADPSTALWVVIAALAWQWNALSTVVFLAGLQNVPAELRDAARIDGASPLRVLRDVTLPFLAPAFTTVNVLLAVFAFRAFDLVYVLTGPAGAPDGATLVMGTSVYITAFPQGQFAGQGNYSYAMAQGIFLMVVLGIAALSLLTFLRRREKRVLS